jgi:hypothetical protein
MAMLHSLATMKKKENHTDHHVVETRFCETICPPHKNQNFIPHKPIPSLYVMFNIDEPELRSPKALAPSRAIIKFSQRYHLAIQNFPQQLI